MDGSPNASPAWIVMWKFARWMNSNASRWRLGGIALLGAGDIEPDDARHPASARRTPRSPRNGRLAHRGHERFMAMGWPAASAASAPRPNPSSLAATTSSSVSPRSVDSSGA